MIERDDFQGPPSSANPPRQIRGDRFNFPLQSIESLTPIDALTLLVGLDNNYPGGNGRVPGTPDGTEIITLRSAEPLKSLRVEPCPGRVHGGRRGSDHDEDRDDEDRDDAYR